MKRFIATGIVLISLISGCAVTSQEPTAFRTSNNLVFELSESRFDTIDVQPFEIQLWLDSTMVGSLMTMETNPDFASAVDEVQQGFIEAQKSSGRVIRLDLDDRAYGFAITLNGYTTAFIANSEHPASWVTISTQDDVFDEVLSSLSMSKTRK